MQYTIRKIPPAVDRALRRQAKLQGRSLNEVVVEALARATGAGGEPVRHRTLRDLAGTWVSGRETDAALAEQDQVDEDLWK